MKILLLIIVFIIIYYFFYKSSEKYDNNYNNDYIKSIKKPGEEYEYYYYSLNRTPTSSTIPEYNYVQIENDSCRGTVQKPFNFFNPIKVRWNDSEKGNPEVEYVI